VFRFGPYRFFFFSREEKRTHVHVYCGDGEAKFWIHPRVSLAKNYGLTRQQLTAVKKLIEDHRNEIIQAWRTHFPG
jgi:hypothetical protein